MSFRNYFFIMSNSKKTREPILALWLLFVCFFILLTLVVGGITRLTESGLSITVWLPVSGFLPPLNDGNWSALFEQYKKIPQYKIIFPEMALEEFKVIYWWEWLHRNLGRTVGIVFILPFLFFSIEGRINFRLAIKLLLILILILIQGYIGWLMVKSGLSQKITVSHYRLALHLFMAFVIFGLTLWQALNLLAGRKLYINYTNRGFVTAVFFILSLFYVQVIFGALVSGLDAGLAFNTWPLMDGYIYPPELLNSKLFTVEIFDNPGFVQFVHRIFAYLIFFLFLCLIIYSMNKYIFKPILFRALYLLLTLFLVQMVLGILALLTNLQILIALAHQLTSVLILTNLIYILHLACTVDFTRKKVTW